MANVYINNNKLIPAPFYGISHEINRSGDGDILSCSYSIVLTGSIVCNRGSPDSTGTFGTDSDETASIFSSPDRFKSMLQKQAAIKTQALGEPGVGSAKSVVIVHVDDGSGLETATRIEFNYFASNVEFEPSQTVGVSNYTISFTANDIKYNGVSVNPASTNALTDYNLRSATDSLSIDWSNDADNTVSVTRNVSAQSSKQFQADVIDEELSLTAAWEYAREWVKSRFPTDIREGPSSALTGVPVLSLPADYLYVNAIIGEQTDKLDGTFSISAKWLYAPSKVTASGSSFYAADDYTISRTQALVGNKTNFKVSGTIRGFQDSTRAKTAGQVALLYFNALTTADLKTRITNAFSVSSVNINGPIVNNSIYNEFGGTVSYDLEFYEKFLSLPGCFTDFDLSMSKNEDERVVAEVGIPGRAAGPLIQDIKTIQSVKRTISANFVLASGFSSFSHLPGLKASGFTFLSGVSALPTGTENTSFWKTGFSHTMDISGGKYSMNINYVEDN